MEKQTKSAQPARRIGVAEAFCNARIALGRVTLSQSDFVRESGLTEIATKRQLSRLQTKVVKIFPRLMNNMLDTILQHRIIYVLRESRPMRAVQFLQQCQNF